MDNGVELFLNINYEMHGAVACFFRVTWLVVSEVLSASYLAAAPSPA